MNDPRLHLVFLAGRAVANAKNYLDGRRSGAALGLNAGADVADLLAVPFAERSDLYEPVRILTWLAVKTATSEDEQREAFAKALAAFADLVKSEAARVSREIPDDISDDIGRAAAASPGSGSPSAPAIGEPRRACAAGTPARALLDIGPEFEARARERIAEQTTGIGLRNTVVRRPRP